MSQTAEKSHVAKPPSSTTTAEGAFFRKAGEQGFFGAREGAGFFPAQVQTKLEVSHPDDPQEKEADAVADSVMRMPAPEPAGAGESPERREESGPSVQRSPLPAVRIHRQAGWGGFASDLDAGDGGGSSTMVQTKTQGGGISADLARSARGPPVGASTPSTTPTFESSLASTKGSGSPLPSDVRQSMESRFGADFGGVRVHTGSGAEGLSAGIGAQAFTHGNDIYFNSGKYDPGSTSGGHLLAHELTHTIQQGASQPRADAKAQRSPASRPAEAIQRRNLSRSLQRSEAGSQRQAAVELAKAEAGKVSAKEPGPDGNRTGWERLLEYFRTTFGEDRILPVGAGFQQDTVNEAQIRTISTFRGDVMGGDGLTVLHDQERDAMPSWCGIFAFWALNKGGIPLRKWRLGQSIIPPDAALPGGHVPQPGDIAWRREFSHYALVASADATTVTTVNGNTAGDDNVGGQIQVLTHPRSHWYAFFDPTRMMDGSLRDPASPENAGAAPVRSLRELRKALFRVDRKAQPETSSKPPAQEPEEKLQAKVEETPEPETVAASAGGSGSGGVGEGAAEDQDEPGPGAGASIGVHASLQRAAKPEKEREREAETASSVTESVQRAAVPEEKETEATSRDEATIQRTPLDTRSRGPPVVPSQVLSKVGRRIQRWSLSGAWDAVSGALGEAAAWVERGLDAAKEWMLEQVRDFVSNIRGYRLLCLILGEDPITGAAAPLTGESLLEAGLDILPGGSMFRSLFVRLGIYGDVATWLQGRIEDLSSLASGIGDRFARFWNDLSLDDVGDPSGVLERVGALLRGTMEGIVGFVERSASTLLEMIKTVMVREIAAFVRSRLPNLYPLLTVALGFDPETMQDVPRNGTNILDAFLEVSEDGREQRKQMLETGTFQRIAAWIDRGIAVFSTAWTMLRAAIAGVWDFVTIENLFSPLDTFGRIWETFAAPVRIVTDFVVEAALEILRVIKDAILGRLSAYAGETRGYPLLCVIIGRDPFTGVVVPRTVHNVVRGFMSLVEGGEEQYNQLRESGAIDRIVAKVEAAVERLGMTPGAIIQLFVDLWNSFSIRDLARPLECFGRIVATFGTPIVRLVRFVIEIVIIAIEAILILMNFPFAIVANILAKAREAWELIKSDPAGFFKNILRAIKQGFIQFFDNIGTHLLNGVVGWLMAELRDAGVPILTDFSLRGVIGWVLEVLGISMERIWEKLAAHPRIGPERVARIRGMINTLEGIWTFIQDVQERGMAAIWDKIQEQLANLWNTVLDAVKNWIMERIVGAVTTRLLSMLDPTGVMAVVNSVLAMYRAVQSFIRYITEMLQVVNSFVEGVLEIAQGNIQSAADYLENAMGRAMPVVIGFLANQVGLSGVGRRVAEMIERVRGMVDEALTWLVNRAVDTGMALLDRVMAMGRSAVAAVREWWRGRKEFRAADGEQHALYLTGSGASARLMIASTPKTYGEFLTGLTVDASKLDDKNRAIAIANRLDQAVARAASGSSGSGAAPAAAGAPAVDPATEIQGLLEELSVVTATLMPAHGAGASTPPVYGGLHSGYGSSATVVRLAGTTPIPGGGSPSSSTDSHPGWQKLRRRMDGGGTYYVRGHLLNDNLGGPGNTWTNLTPLTQGANNRDGDSHLHGFETPVKNAVDAGKAVNFQVTAQYGRPDRSGDITFLRNQGNPDDDVVADIIEAEMDIPTTLDCRAYEVNASGANGAAIAVHTVNNQVQTAVASYSLSPVRKVDVYLNDMSEAQFKELNGIGDTLAADLFANKPFRNRRQLQERVHIADGRWNQMQSTPGKRVRIYRL